ncbi:MAG: hypothetical protein RSE57_06835 [Clostridia bacterium]
MDIKELISIILENPKTFSLFLGFGIIAAIAGYYLDFKIFNSATVLFAVSVIGVLYNFLKLIEKINN